MTDLVLTKTVFLKAPPEHVWKFLTEADKLATWFYRGAHDLSAGGDYELVTNSLGKEGEKMCWGRILEFEPPTRLVHSFTHNFLEGAETLCDWTLEAVDGGTILTLRHSGWENVGDGAFGMAANHDKGWDEFFARLRHVTN